MKSLLIGMICMVIGTGMSSCAYMQTHKNVIESTRVHHGFILEKPTHVYKQAGNWYLKVKGVQLEKQYPTIHDDVFQDGNNEPQYVISPRYNPGYYYIKLSAGTANVLQRQDGYATLETLKEEMAAHYKNRILADSTQMAAYPIRAEIAPCTKPMIYCGSTFQGERSLGNKVLTNTALIFVDTPGTLIYNLAIPIMAPVYFFTEFFKEDHL